MRPLPMLLKVLLGAVLVLFCAGLVASASAESSMWTSTGPEDSDVPGSLVFLPLLTIHTPSLCDAVTGIPPHECAALVALYDSSNGPGWTYNDDWLITNTPCSWYGVTCQTNHVHRIVLSSNALSGTIPIMLGDLANLRALQLDHNQLNGPLPDSLRQLNLYRFHFDDTSLCEPSSTEFQAWLAGIPDLRRTGERCHPFTEITTGAIVNDGGYSSGACWGDYDNDGYDDVFVANWSGENNFLYHNDGDGTFTKITEGSIVTDGGSSRSCTWGDYDNDGFLDLFVSNDGGGNFLYHNEGGTAFTRALSGPIASDGGNCYGASWADYDNDGWLDLFVARHTNDNNLLYHNAGDGTLEKIEEGAIVNDGGYSVSASWGDYNGDGCADLVVANTNDQPNFLYRNNCDGSFTKIITGPVVTDIGSSGTSNWVDFDNDGDLDLFIGNSGENQDNVLYRNDAGDTFTAIRTGVIVTDGDGHNSSWGDYDNDGDLDLFAGLAPLVQRLYQNNGDGTFTRLTNGAVVQDSGASGGLWGDYDNDGDLDLFVAVDRDGNNHLYRNEGNQNHWLHLKLIGAASNQTHTGVGSNRSAIGARITAVATIGGRAVQQVQEVSGQTGMYNQNSLDVEFGLGDATVVDTLTVRWPSGVVQTLTDVAADQFLTLADDTAKIYFAAGDVLYQMNLDGSDLRNVASGLANNRNQSLFADPTSNTIFANGWDQPVQIRVLDASTGVLSDFSDGPGYGGGGLAVDQEGHTLYEGLYYNGVYALDMNIGSWTQLVDSGELYPMHGQRGQLQIDPDRRHIYFRTSYNGNCGECRYIWRVGFDGDDLTQIVTANGGDAMALDLSERKMYFSDMPGDGTIKWSTMEPGSSKETLFTLPEPYRYCRSIHLDLENSKMYLNLYNEDTGYRDRAIARMNMDGTGFEILHTLTGNDWLDIHGDVALFLPAPPPPPLLVKYDFEDDFLATGTVIDRSGNGHDAQVTGEVAVGASISGGQGISFNGNGYVQAASNPAAGITDITFSLWFKTDHPEENYKLASAAWWNWDLRASGWIIGTHIPEFWSDDESGLYLPGIVNNDNGFLAGAWNHEVVTYDGSRIKEYTNGQLINDWPTTGAAIGTGLPMAVGAWPMFSGYNFQGSLDEFAIYDRSLTQQEVQALYAQGR